MKILLGFVLGVMVLINGCATSSHVISGTLALLSIQH